MANAREAESAAGVTEEAGALMRTIDPHAGARPALWVEGRHMLSELPVVLYMTAPRPAIMGAGRGSEILEARPVRIRPAPAS